MNSILEKLKGGYYFFEDKYYALLDRIDTKVPVYKIIDPIDKIFPSFVLLLIIIAALVIFLLLPVISAIRAWVLFWRLEAVSLVVFLFFEQYFYS